MFQLHASHTGPMVIVHGGAGPQDPSSRGMQKATNALLAAATAACHALIAGECGERAVTEALGSMEDAEIFNAGYGAALQSDGVARVTAALMCGEAQSFSGVMGGTHLKHPSLLALALQDRTSRVLGPPGVDLLARELNAQPHSLVTPERLQRWAEKAQGGFSWAADTVGCVLRDPVGRLFAGTSTGGRGFEYPGRISDSATVAGNYASKHLAVSATGVGEEIVDDALAARLETRVRDGASLAKASEKTFSEARARNRNYGWIALTSLGAYDVSFTTTAMSFVVMAADGTVLNSSDPGVSSD